MTLSQISPFHGSRRMVVKDLVELFNPPSSVTRALDADSISSPPRRSSLAVSNSSSRHEPTRRIPIPARFLDRTGRNNTTTSTSFTTITMTSKDEYEMTSDITDNLKLDSSPLSGLPRPGSSNNTTIHDLYEREDELPLLSKGSYEYPITNKSDIPSSPPAYSRHSRQHTPIAATVVFSPNAAPVHLPKLDEHLASLLPPNFFHTEQESKTMFPPMDKLAELGKSLDDLESNNTKAPAWRNRKTILGSAVNLVLGLTGSSALASFYSLQGLFNTVQVFALILSTIVPVGGPNLGDKWRKLFLGTIPNILALNFASTLVQSLFFLLIFMAISAGLLYYFYRSSFHCDRYDIVEGLQQTGPKGNQWGLVIVTFLLTVIYLPLSTMAVHVLVWSQDLWVVPNPYTNATSYPPTVAPLGPASEYRDPLDFCWTTTMKRNQVNYAPVVIVLSAVVFLALTIWFPIALRQVIRQSVPRVDKFTELGRARNKVEMDGEYHRLLSRDRNAFAFLYSGFRRGWGTYESTYLGAKFSTLVIIAVIDPNNCLFRSLSRYNLSVIRQVLLLLSTIGFFIAQCIFAPFLDPVNNASEWTSRLNYLTTSAVALAIALKVPGEDIFNTYVLYTIYIITYGLSFYFTIINLGFMQRTVKRLTHRIDFSIDIFSPRLDISPESPHTKRRIWQESITTLFLTNPECSIPKEQPMAFAQARDSEFPPYLLEFCGTPGERHVENLKILREVGNLAYRKAVALVSGPDYSWYREMEDEIQKNHIGPDCYWKNSTAPAVPGCTNYFGNAWWIPFPPTLVIRYDDGPLAVLTESSDLKAYILQNCSPDIQQRRNVRMALRALEGQIVKWPYEHISPIGAHSGGWLGGEHYGAQKSTSYRTCLLRINRHGYLDWKGFQLGSGFNVELMYSKKIKLDGEVIGLNDDYDLTAPLARFLKTNETLIPERLHRIEEAISSYRHHHQKVYDTPHDPTGPTRAPTKHERDTRVRQLMVNSEAIFKIAYERLAVVSRSEATTWWYIFWDDLWRRNYDTIVGLQRYSTDFNPHYPTSIAYTPLPRAVLESFLIQRGLLSKTGQARTFFTSGFLNKLYVRLNDAVFRSSGMAIMFHIGDGGTERDMLEVDLETRAGQLSTIGTGGGTDHDDSWIRTRPNYRWESILNDPPSKGKQGRRKFLTKLGAWLGLTPLWRSGTPSSGISLDVRLEDGRYVTIEDRGGD